MPGQYGCVRFRRGLARATACVAVVVAAAAVATATPATGAPAPIDWSTVGVNLQRTGDNSSEVGISPSSVPSGLPATPTWSNTLGSVLDAPSVVAAGVDVDGTPTNLAFVGSENGVFRAINADTGATVWEQDLASHVGGSINPGCEDSPFGVSGSAVVDHAAGRVYVVDGNVVLHAFDLATGAEIAGWPVALSTLTQYEHSWSGLVLHDGVVDVAIASDCDNGDYRGRIVAVSTTTAQVVATFDAEPADGPAGGSIWGWGGASIDPTDTHLFVGTGPAAGDDTNAGYADQVVELDPTTLAEQSADEPGIPQGDNDFGSTPVLFQRPGCDAQLAVENKTGVLFLYGQDSLAAGPEQTLQLASSAQSSFIGDPAWDGDDDTLYVADSSASAPYVNGMVALTDGPDCRLSLSWQDQLGPANSVVSPPTVANGVVFFGDGEGDTVYGLDATSGATLWSAAIGAPVFAPLTVVNGEVLASTWNGTLEAFALSPPPADALPTGAIGGAGLAVVAAAGLAVRTGWSRRRRAATVTSP